MQFKQFIYSAENSNYNFPSDINKTKLINGDIFSNYVIYQLGIQAPPGTRFYVNNNVNPIIVGYTGLFDLNLSDGGSIYSLRFDQESIDWIRVTETAILIIDILYLDGGN